MALPEDGQIISIAAADGWQAVFEDSQDDDPNHIELVFTPLACWALYEFTLEDGQKRRCVRGMISVEFSEIWFADDDHRRHVTYLSKAGDERDEDDLMSRARITKEMRLEKEQERG